MKPRVFFLEKKRGGSGVVLPQLTDKQVEDLWKKVSSLDSKASNFKGSKRDYLSKTFKLMKYFNSKQKMGKGKDDPVPAAGGPDPVPDDPDAGSVSGSDDGSVGEPEVPKEFEDLKKISRWNPKYFETHPGTEKRPQKVKEFKDTSHRVFPLGYEPPEPVVLATKKRTKEERAKELADVAQINRDLTREAIRKYVQENEVKLPKLTEKQITKIQTTNPQGASETESEYLERLVILQENKKLDNLLSRYKGQPNPFIKQVGVSEEEKSIIRDEREELISKVSIIEKTESLEGIPKEKFEEIFDEYRDTIIAFQNPIAIKNFFLAAPFKNLTSMGEEGILERVSYTSLLFESGRPTVSGGWYDSDTNEAAYVTELCFVKEFLQSPTLSERFLDEDIPFRITIRDEGVEKELTGKKLEYFLLGKLFSKELGHSRIDFETSDYLIELKGNPTSKDWFSGKAPQNQVDLDKISNILFASIDTGKIAKIFFLGYYNNAEIIRLSTQNYGKDSIDYISEFDVEKLKRITEKAEEYLQLPKLLLEEKKLEEDAGAYIEHKSDLEKERTQLIQDAENKQKTITELTEKLKTEKNKKIKESINKEIVRLTTQSLDTLGRSEALKKEIKKTQNYLNPILNKIRSINGIRQKYLKISEENKKIYEAWGKVKVFKDKASEFTRGSNKHYKALEESTPDFYNFFVAATGITPQKNSQKAKTSYLVSTPLTKTDFFSVVFTNDRVFTSRNESLAKRVTDGIKSRRRPVLSYSRSVEITPTEERDFLIAERQKEQEREIRRAERLKQLEELLTPQAATSSSPPEAAAAQAVPSPKYARLSELLEATKDKTPVEKLSELLLFSPKSQDSARYAPALQGAFKELFKNKDKEITAEKILKMIDNEKKTEYNHAKSVTKGAILKKWITNNINLSTGGINPDAITTDTNIKKSVEQATNEVAKTVFAIPSSKRTVTKGRK